MNRAGLLNFWYYDEEIFHFEDGKLLLRGTNGSGKSVTMQSFIPVLLDGRKSPDRLDPFGSKARRMEDYLLGEKEIVDREERTGYLFIEYKKQGAEQYITTGIGMQARRNKGLKSWYFVITDNRRIHMDFELAHKTGDEPVPLSAKELENRIATGGHVVHSQREYLELVNKYVFGFESTEAYEDLIKLLIQLRSPKLSKDFKPTVIYEILESALPPLSDEELRHLSETIESMDQTQQQLDQLEREFTANEKLMKQYDPYNHYMLAERAEKVAQAQAKLENVTNENERLITEAHQLQQLIEQLKLDQKQYYIEKGVAEEEEQSLQNHEVWRLQKDLTTQTEELLKKEQQLQNYSDKVEEQKKKHRHAVDEDRELQDDLYTFQKKQQEQLDIMGDDAEESAFIQHAINKEDSQKPRATPFDFTLWEKEAKGHLDYLRQVEKLVEKEQLYHDEYKEFEHNSSAKRQ